MRAGAALALAALLLPQARRSTRRARTSSAAATRSSASTTSTPSARDLDNEAEMAGVLGHEIGHVTARHAARPTRGRPAWASAPR